MAMGPGGADQLPALSLDQPVPRAILNRRRNGVSFCSSSSYLTQPRYERRGGISYERADKNAIYVRALGDGRMRGKASGLGDSGQLLEWELKLIEKLSVPECKMRFRSRFLSMHKVHRRRRPNLRLSRDNKQTLDDYYYRPAQLLLTRVGAWDFNVFHLDSLTGGRSLLYLAYHIFREYGFIQRFRLDVVKLLRFFSCIEENYHDSNPYHNIIHATDVTQAMYCYLQEEKLHNTVTPFEAMIAIISAMAHDLDHPGVNQTFLVATANHLAALYQNTSVLEMHHWRYGVGLMQECGIFSHFTNQQWATALWQFRSLILATDITRQQEFLLKFRRMIDEKEFDYESNLNSRHFVLQIALKCADICNPCRNWQLSEKWSRQVCEEFFRQGDMERQVGVPVTPVCDRHANTVAKIQIGFMEVVVRPLFMEWKRFLPTELSRQMLENILTNKQHWQAIGEQEALAKVAAVPKPDNANPLAPSTENAPTSSSGHDGNRNNAGTVFEEEEEEVEGEGEEGMDNLLEASLAGLQERLQILRRHSQGQGGQSDGEGEESCEEEEGHGEEADTVHNDVNLVFHYQTDSEQLHSGDGSCSLSQGGQLGASEDEHLLQLVRNSRRRHSMPVVVRKDLGFYMGLRRDSFTRSNFQRRQSLPAAATPTLVQASLLSALRGGGSGESTPSPLSVEGLTTRPKISNLSASVDTPRLDHLSFLPLQSQTRLLQRGGVWAWGAGPNDNDQPAALLLQSHPLHHHHPHHPSSSHPHHSQKRRQSSSSCMELREDSERLKAAVSRLVVGGARACQQQLVGLASSWPSILRAGHKVDEAQLRLLGLSPSSSPSPSPSPAASTDSSPSPSSSSHADSNGSVPGCLSAPPQAECVPLLSRPH